MKYQHLHGHVDDGSTRPSILLQAQFLIFSFVHASVIFTQLMLILVKKNSLMLQRMRTCILWTSSS